MPFQSINKAAAAQVSADAAVLVPGSEIDLAQTDNGEFCYLLYNEGPNSINLDLNMSSDGVNWINDPARTLTFALASTTPMLLNSQLVSGGICTLRFIRLGLRSSFAGMPGTLEFNGAFAK